MTHTTKTDAPETATLEDLDSATLADLEKFTLPIAAAMSLGYRLNNSDDATLRIAADSAISLAREIAYAAEFPRHLIDSLIDASEGETHAEIMSHARKLAAAQ